MESFDPIQHFEALTEGKDGILCAPELVSFLSRFSEGVQEEAVWGLLERMKGDRRPAERGERGVFLEEFVEFTICNLSSLDGLVRSRHKYSATCVCPSLVEEEGLARLLLADMRAERAIDETRREALETLGGPEGLWMAFDFLDARSEWSVTPGGLTEVLNGSAVSPVSFLDVKGFFRRFDRRRLLPSGRRTRDRRLSCQDFVRALLPFSSSEQGGAVSNEAEVEEVTAEIERRAAVKPKEFESCGTHGGAKRVAWKGQGTTRPQEMEATLPPESQRRRRVYRHEDAEGQVEENQPHSSGGGGKGKGRSSEGRSTKMKTKLGTNDDPYTAGLRSVKWPREGRGAPVSGEGAEETGKKRQTGIDKRQFRLSRGPPSSSEGRQRGGQGETTQRTAKQMCAAFPTRRQPWSTWRGSRDSPPRSPKVRPCCSSHPNPEGVHEEEEEGCRETAREEGHAEGQEEQMDAGNWTHSQYQLGNLSFPLGFTAQANGSIRSPRDETGQRIVEEDPAGCCCGLRRCPEGDPPQPPSPRGSTPPPHDPFRSQGEYLPSPPECFSPVAAPGTSKTLAELSRAVDRVLASCHAYGNEKFLLRHQPGTLAGVGRFGSDERSCAPPGMCQRGIREASHPLAVSFARCDQTWETSGGIQSLHEKAVSREAHGGSCVQKQNQSLCGVGVVCRGCGAMTDSSSSWRCDYCECPHGRMSCSPVEV
uniref:Uncharacterized protein n=1 Tax=Chromera velia CCMP2878 TaxID=1169474 RepID=A0A0G4HQQ9_9ALVE|eukprot:Cvel_1257.t1-p1 / transcript=Cvel_1257.t1 / gene=Cvel_1257 / organism=Chromera_velia_CCMP2878 / gene_product=hypothetical protein / transcript_product=hypothetical protein / location=Cvel_scaffold42:51109-57463(+) / protein_length=705 / sequence_SO=supercontig / SO=protein_coding / is_pseudo=false